MRRAAGDVALLFFGKGPEIVIRIPAGIRCLALIGPGTFISVFGTHAISRNILFTFSGDGPLELIRVKDRVADRCRGKSKKTIVNASRIRSAVPFFTYLLESDRAVLRRR
jgi:hypothetical protein